MYQSSICILSSFIKVSKSKFLTVYTEYLSTCKCITLNDVVTHNHQLLLTFNVFEPTALKQTP